MSIVFDEVVGTVQGREPSGGDERPAASPAPSEEEARRRFRAQLSAHKRRLDRVRAT